MITFHGPPSKKIETKILHPKSVEQSPALENSLNSALARIPYNLIPSKDMIEQEKALPISDNIIIPILTEGLKDNEGPKDIEVPKENPFTLSQEPSRRGSKMVLIAPDSSKRKSITSDSVNLQASLANKSKTEPEIDVFGKLDFAKNGLQSLDRMLAHWTFQVLINSFTVWCLFADDFRMLFAPVYPGDTVFNVINLVCMSLFLIEIFVSSISRRGYFFSFFFFMDLISTLIIAFDLTWVQDSLISSSLNTKKKIPSASLKIMRIIRLVRLIRLFKLYKSFKEKKRFKSVDKLMRIESLLQEAKSKLDRRVTRQSLTEVNYERQKAEKLLQEKEKLIMKETRIGKQILERTVKIAVVMVLVLVFCGPLFQSTFFFADTRGYVIDLKIMSNLEPNNTDQATILSYYNSYIDIQTKQKYPLIHCEIPILNQTYNSVDLTTLRNQEMEVYSVDVPYTDANFIAIIDLRPLTHNTAIINILRTLYVAVVLLVTCVLINRDLNTYVILPLSRMIMNINKIANNPLASKENFMFNKRKGKEFNETEFIEEAIVKTGVLLALGFGEAGSISITQNISNEGDLVATIPGTKTFAIFGFCDIRNFTDTTEILQEEVMVFVNSIAEIVHGLVDKYGGAANKNIGDAFLLVWKIPESEITKGIDGTLALKKSRITKNISDLALISFIKIICAVNKMPRFLKYRSHPGLLQRIPNYQIKMGFGLHLGWAIEGTIGSEFKIDASYLSPNVNMAARLEAATKQYKSLLLISNDFMEYTSKETKRYCREIDRVTVKGSIKPIGIFTVDLDLGSLPILEPPPTDKKQSFMERKSLMERVTNKSEKLNEIFTLDKDLVQSMAICKGEFKDTFDQGFMKYVEGNWQEARNILEKCLEMRSGDGPSQVLMHVMEENSFEKPTNWQGYRVLTEK